jgi:outer membrane protein assembly factor BamB
MPNLVRLTCAAAVVGGLIALPVVTRTARAPKPGVDWPQFRGIRASGISEGFPLPAAWDVAKGSRIAWKTTIPGMGHSSPIVWGDLVCLSTAISGKKDANLRIGYYGDVDSVADDTPHEWRLYCLDKKTGAVRWQQSVLTAVPKVKRHMKATHANSTLATDGERLIAFFGSEGLYAYDLKGKPLWKKDLGVLDAGWFTDPSYQWETGSSPIVHDNVVVVQADVQKGSFLAGFDARDGRELWRTDRDEVPTWGTPTVHDVNGRAQLAVNGWHHIGGYDLATGKEIWKLVGGGDIPIPTPVVHDGLIFVTNAHGPRAPVYAIREAARGNITPADGAVGATSTEGIAWSAAKDGGYMCTPLVYRGLVYIIKYNGGLTVYDAKTGEQKFQQRIAPSAFTASPVAADGKIYVANEDGRVFVLKPGPAFELLAENDMGEPVLATPAISEGTLLIRTKTQIIAVRDTQS